MGMTLEDAANVARQLRLFLWARGYSELQVIEGCRDGHWMLFQLQQLERRDIDDQIGLLAKIIVLLERGYHFEGHQLLEQAANNWTKETTAVVAGKHPSLLAQLPVVEI